MQKNAADNIIVQKMSGRVNKKEALKKAGYSDAVTKTPKLVTESKGFLVYMDESGLTEENLATYLAADIKDKPANRLGELKLAMEVRGLKDNTINVNMKKADDALLLMKSIIDEEENKKDKEDKEDGEDKENEETI